MDYKKIGHAFILWEIFLDQVKIRLPLLRYHLVDSFEQLKTLSF